jgi:hypothetical protein
MRIAALIIGIIGSLAGIGGALFALMVGGLSGVFGAEGAEMVVGLGWAAIVISLIALVAAALAIAKPLEAGIAMIIAGIAGIISISVAYVIGGPLLIIAGILAIIGKKELTDTLPSILTDKAYRNCPYCAEKIRANSVECEYCNSELSPVNDAEAEQEKSMVCAEWIIATILLPLIGLVGGMYGLIKGRRGAGGLFGISILACIVAIIALSVTYSTPDAPRSSKEELTSKTGEPAYVDEGATTPKPEPQQGEEETPGSTDTGPGETDRATLGEKNALKKAESYLSFMPFSYSGLVKQLEFEGFSHEEAVYGADHCGADWYEQAALKAETYLDFMAFSRDGLISQLEFEGFTRQQAEYGAKAVGY